MWNEKWWYNKMKVESTILKEVKVIEYDQKFDNRGFSHSIYNKSPLFQTDSI